MSKRASVDEKGLDILFGTGNHAGKTEKQKDSKKVNQINRKQARQKNRKTANRKKDRSKGKVKQTYYIEDNTALLLDEIQLQLRREHGLRPSQASKSAIVQAVLALQAENVAQIAQRLSEGL